jgi:hypothetical protein
MIPQRHRIPTAHIVIALLLLFCTEQAPAQVGNIIIPAGAEIIIPVGATLCADTIFANNPGYGTLTYTNANSICRAVLMPVELVHLSAALVNGSVLLSWSTAGESNSHGFEIQRQEASRSGWVPLGFVPGAGTTSEARTYQFVDGLQGLSSTMTMLYYRLRMIDTDGSYEHSPEVDVSFDALPASLTLSIPYPNPASDRLMVPFTLPLDATVRIALYDMSGALQMIVTQGSSYARGAHAVLMHITGLSNGTYMLELLAGSDRRTAMIGVVHGR